MKGPQHGSYGRSHAYEHSPRRDEARQLKASGKTYAEVGSIMGVSRQRAQQLVSPALLELRNLRQAAGEKCANCGATDCKLDLHHDDYNGAPTRLLCASCHKTADAQLGLVRHDRKPAKQYPKTPGGATLWSTNTSGYRGIVFHEPSGKWTARIQINGKPVSLQYHATPEAAARAFDAAQRKYYGEDAKCNFPSASQPEPAADPKTNGKTK